MDYVWMWTIAINDMPIGRYRDTESRDIAIKKYIADNKIESPKVYIGLNKIRKDLLY